MVKDKGSKAFSEKVVMSFKLGKDFFKRENVINFVIRSVLIMKSSFDGLVRAKFRLHRNEG